MRTELNSEHGVRLIPLLALSLLLAGCGESTNIQSSSSGNVASCESLLNADCVAGRFIDAAASNVDYECGLSGTGTVRSVTGDDGSFVCPNGSTVTFALINPDSPEDRIELGQVVVAKPAQIYSDNSSSSSSSNSDGSTATSYKSYFYVNPAALAGDNSNSSFSSKAKNIARLLQTMSDTDAANKALPSYYIHIADADKKKIFNSILGELSFNSSPAADADRSSPAESTFDYGVKTYLESISKFPLVPASEATKYMQQGLYSAAAGIYASGPGLLATGTPFDASLGVMTGVGSGKNFVGTFWELVDRAGRVTGSGVYSFGSSSDPQFPWSLISNPQAMVLTDTGVSSQAGPLWPNNGDLSSIKFVLKGSADAGKSVAFTNGVMRREAVAGATDLYATLFGETGTDSVLGKWSLESASSADISNGAYTMLHTIPVAVLMNPDLWSRTALDFPIPIKVGFYNSDYGNPSCDPQLGCKIAEVRMVILEDGNIVSDFSRRCGQDPYIDSNSMLQHRALDPVTLKYSTGEQEVPFGVVANAQDGEEPGSTLQDVSGTPIKALSLLAMLPDDSRLIGDLQSDPGFSSYANYVPYIQFGSNLGDYSLLRIDGSGTNKFQIYGFCSSNLQTKGFCSVSGKFKAKIGTWLNPYTILQASKRPAPANALQLQRNSAGFMESALLDKTDSSVCQP